MSRESHAESSSQTAWPFATLVPSGRIRMIVAPPSTRQPRPTAGSPPGGPTPAMVARSLPGLTTATGVSPARLAWAPAAGSGATAAAFSRARRGCRRRCAGGKEDLATFHHPDLAMGPTPSGSG